MLATVNPNYNPNNIFRSHTWVRFAQGKTLVGVDESDTDFNIVGKTGGEKSHKLTIAEMPSHQHTTNTAYGATGFTSGRSASYGTEGSFVTNSSKLLPNGGDTAHNNLQPYETVFYWKRIK